MSDRHAADRRVRRPKCEYRKREAQRRHADDAETGRSIMTRPADKQADPGADRATEYHGGDGPELPESGIDVQLKHSGARYEGDNARQARDRQDAPPRLHDLFAQATGCEIEARPHRLGYQLILDQGPVDWLTRMLRPAGDES